MAAASLLVWAHLEYNIHHHGCGSMASVEAWYVKIRLCHMSPYSNHSKPLPYSEHSVYIGRWLGSTAGCTGSLGIPACLQSVLEPTVLFEARHGISAL